MTARMMLAPEEQMTIEEFLAFTNMPLADIYR